MRAVSKAAAFLFVSVLGVQAEGALLVKEWT